MLLFSLIAALTITVGIGRMLRDCLPALRGARDALAGCPEMREFRFRIVETRVSWNDGGVVALPLRAKAVYSRPVRELRAAA